MHFRMAKPLVVQKQGYWMKSIGPPTNHSRYLKRCDKGQIKYRIVKRQKFFCRGSVKKMNITDSVLLCLMGYSIRIKTIFAFQTHF